LLDAAKTLAKAHGAGSADDLRNAQDRFRNALRKLVGDLAGMAERSVSDAVEQRLIATLRAASVDPDLAALLRRGVLPDEVDFAGFDALAGIPLKRRRESAAPKPAGDSGRSGRADPNRRARRARLQRELAEATRELRSAERAVNAAERERDRKAKRVSHLEGRLSKHSTS
jgi:hypothetical protein